jgi:hypothetical protein
MTTSLLQKLQEASENSSRKCKYAVILDKLDVETQEFIQERISLPHKHPHKLSYAKLSVVLKSEKHLVGPSTIGDHYNGICGCKTQEEANA